MKLKELLAILGKCNPESNVEIFAAVGDESTKIKFVEWDLTNNKTILYDHIPQWEEITIFQTEPTEPIEEGENFTETRITKTVTTLDEIRKS